jgi:hypothetical protein
MRDIVATYVFRLTVVAARKHAKDFNIKQIGISQGVLRGVLFAAIAEMVRDDENTSRGTVLGGECKHFGRIRRIKESSERRQ